MYVSRVRGLREAKEKEQYHNQNKPGSGNCWKKGITISEEFNLTTKKNKHPPIGHSDIKSLQMPLVLDKYTLSNNYQPGDQRLTQKSYSQLETEVLRSQENPSAYQNNVMFFIIIRFV